MSSLRRIRASQVNGALSKGPVTVLGKQRSSQNALDHGLLSRQGVMRDESPEAFQIVVNQHLLRLQPADGVEFGLVEEMIAAHWRLRRAWAIEIRILDNEAGAQPSPDPLDRMADAFTSLADKPSLGLMHRYQTRLHLNYQRALYNMLLLRAATVPNEPSPISDPPRDLPLRLTPLSSCADESLAIGVRLGRLERRLFHFDAGCLGNLIDRPNRREPEARAGKVRRASATFREIFR